MEHDVIILYLIAGVSFTFALFNCILFALKHGKTMKTDGMIVSIKSTNPTNEKWKCKTGRGFLSGKWQADCVKKSHTGFSYLRDRNAYSYPI